ncbi:hypothetical protein R1sor_023439 [Riccia sorocarpa]|uniref:CCZ1/INTU/HSP4 first Longin domain-containing protein n=1 Tax=Riccia sorocarpa TaxID=122646 RepID=A0ABD3GNF2_9MARC
MAERAQVCLFDMSRGQVEGQELDKILFFFPSNCPIPSQLSVVGLSEGLITFTRIFSPLTPCEVMEAERHTHVFYQCEPDLWMVLVVERSKETEETIREGALRAVLKEAHRLFTFFYGSIRALLDSHPRGDVARSCLHAFFPDYLSDFLTGKKFRIPTISESLTDRGTVQLFSPQKETLLEIQSLQEYLKSWFGGGKVRHVMTLFHNMLLSTTLSPADASVLFLYATLRMLPSTLSQAPPRSRSSSRRENPAAATSPLASNSSNITLGSGRLRSLFSNLTTIPTPEVLASPHNPRLYDASLEDQGAKSSVPRPLQQEAWWKDADGFLSTYAWGSQTGRVKVLPNVKLQDSDEALNLCVYQWKSITLVMLVPKSGGSELISHLQQQVLDKAALRIQRLEEKLVKEWPGSNAYHVAGYRYLHSDLNSQVSRSSPANKVATLTMDSLAALNRIRAEIDAEMGRWERRSNMQDKELELCVRTKQNAWVIVRIRDGHELYTVQEKASNTLLHACDAVEKLSRRYFNGIFSSD